MIPFNAELSNRYENVVNATHEDTAARDQSIVGHPPKLDERYEGITQVLSGIGKLAMEPPCLPLKLTMSPGIIGVIGSFLECEEYQRIVTTVQKALGVEPTADTKRFADQERNLGYDTALRVAMDTMAGKEPQIDSKLKAKLLDVNHLEQFTQVVQGEVTSILVDASTEQLKKVISFLQEYCPRLHSLNLSGCKNLTPEILKQLASFTSLHTLSFRKTNITDAGLAQLAGMKLKSLDVSQTEIAGSTLDTLSRDIEELDLSKCYRLTDAEIVGLGLKRNAQGAIVHVAMQLKKLNMSHTNIKGSTLDTLSRNIKELYLRSCRWLIDTEIAGLGLKCNAQGTIVHAAMQLKKLDMSETRISGHSLATLSRDIEELNLSGCNELTDAGIAGLGLKHNAQGAVVHTAMQLKKLDISNTPVTGSTLDTLSRDIKELDLGFCWRLTDAGIAGLGLKHNAQGAVVHTAMRLKRLNMHESMTITGSTLATLSRDIKELDLGSCYRLTDAGIAGLGLKHDAQGAVVHTAMRLRKLNMSQTSITGSTLDTLSRDIEELALHSCYKLTDTGIAGLGLKHNAQSAVVHTAMRLKKLDVSRTEIVGRTLKTLSQDIEELNLGRCRSLTDDGIAGLGLTRSWGTVVRGAMRLKKLDMSYTNIRGSTLDTLSRDIEELNLRSCVWLTDDEVVNLGLNHNAQGAVVHAAMRLKKLDMSETYITGSTLATLSRDIEELALHDCQELTDVGVAKINMFRVVNR